MRWYLVPLMGLIVSTTIGWGQAPPPKKGEAPAAVDGPKVNNKTLEQWSKEFGSKDASRREVAVRAVMFFPPEVGIRAVPGLIAELKKNTTTAHVDLSVRLNICIVLTELFRNGQKVDMKTEAEVINVVRSQLSDRQSSMRFRAIQTLAAIGQEAKIVIPDLLGLLKDQSTYEIRQASAAALSQIAWDKKAPRADVVQALFATLGDPSVQVRIQAVRSLSIIGPTGDTNGAKNFVASLTPLALKDPEPPVQIWARVAILIATKDFTEESLKPIADLMKHDEPQVRAQAVESAGVMAKMTKGLYGPVYNRLTKDTDPSVVLMAIWALTSMDARNAVPDLERLAADPKQHELVRKNAKEAVNILQK